MNEIETCVYIRETCPECLGSCNASEPDKWGCQICRKCNGDGNIRFWQPVSQFAATIAHLVKAKMTP